MKWFVAALTTALVAMTSSAIAAPPGGDIARRVIPLKTQLSAAERAEYAAYLARTFEPEIRARGVDVTQWARKLGKAVGLADAANVQNAVRMPTFNTAIAVLGGQPVTSPSIRQAMADVSASRVTPTLLGSATADTVYTPLPNGRCRIADSRVIASPIGGGVTRSIDVEDTSSYSAQGGSGNSVGNGSTNCGIPSAATSFAVSVTTLTTGQEGFFKIFENGQSFTTGNTIYYTSTVSAANDVIVRSCQTCVDELSVYSSASVNYVIDVIGYFMPPVATALECQDTPNVAQSIAAGNTANVYASACPSGYTQTATNCESASWDMPVVFSHAGACSAKNNGSSAADLRASRTCCRVPGR